MLVNQPSALPTRKLLWTGVTAFVLHGTLGLVGQFFPDVAGAIPGEQWAANLLPLIVGYMVKERA